MIICPNCNKELKDGVKFCDGCGTPIAEAVAQTVAQTIFCPQCGTQTSTEFAFCQQCGASLSNLSEEAVAPVVEDAPAEVAPAAEAPVAPAYVPTATAETAPARKPFKLSGKLIGIGGACVAVVAVLAIVLSMFLGGAGVNNYMLYIKDSEMYFADIPVDEPWKVTKQLVDDADMSDDDLRDARYTLGYYTMLSEDGRILFYVDKISEDADGATLYYRYVNDPDESPVKIDSDVGEYAVNESCDRITYLKGEDGILYQHDLSDKEKIASDVDGFRVSADGKKIFYVTEDGGLYLRYADEDDEEKLDSDVSYIYGINEAFDTVYYKDEDNSLYKLVEGQDEEKIAENVSYTIASYESGEMYFFQQAAEKVTLLDYVEDDLKASDAAMTYPESPEYPSYYSDYYGNYDAYSAAVDRYWKAYEAYTQARADWYDKLDRDELREELADATMDSQTYTLCYYDGEDVTVVADGVSSGSYSTAVDTPVIAFKLYDTSNVKKVKLSQVDSVSDVEDMVEEALYSSYEWYIGAKEDMAVIEQEEGTDFNVTSDGTAVYFLDNIPEDEKHGDLYKVSISGGKPQTPELYDSDVYYSYSLMLDDHLLYYKDVEDYQGEMFIDKEKIDDDMSLFSYSYDSDFGMLYATDWNDGKSRGTLKLYKDGEVETIAEDVHTFRFTPGGDVAYLCDYNTDKMQGDLMLYRGGESEKVDDDVLTIIPVYNTMYHGGYYYW